MMANPQPAGAAEQWLLDSARRLARQGPPTVALALHLSRLRPPAPRPHHRRIARAMLQDAAQRHDGQVLALRGGDLVLLCPDPDGARHGAVAAAAPSAVAALPGLLARLLRADAAEPQRLVSLWPVPPMAAALLDYAASCACAPAAKAAATVPPAAARPAAARPAGDASAALEAAIGGAGVSDLLRRRTAIVLPPPGSSSLGMRPLFHQIAFSLPAIEARCAGAGLRADPYLFRHLARRLDRRMLDLLGARTAPAMLRQALSDAPGGAALHVHLAVASIGAAGFARLAERLRGHGGGGIEIAVTDACADPPAFKAARARVQAAGLALVLGGIAPAALGLLRPEASGADLVKLDWSRQLATPDAAQARRIEAALAAIGPARLVLARANSEGALHWGLARGIRRFQGRHVDAMLAASRLAACAPGADCTLRQCCERAATASEATRAGCRNHPLLDAAFPDAQASAIAAAMAAA